MTDVGEAFVRIRPDTTGFKEEAEGPVASAGKDLGKVFATAFAIGGVAETIKSVVEAATKQNSAFALLDQTLQNAGQSTKGFSASLHDTLEVQARATGISAEDLAAGLTRIVAVTHNTASALKDLGVAEDLSRQRHIDLATAALAVAKAESGSFTSLQRYLGKIPQVTSAVDALKAKYNDLVASGAKLDTAQKQQYEAQLQIAESSDKAATAQNALRLAGDQAAGSAQKFADTYEGQFQRLDVAVDQLKVGLGTELVGGLASAAGGLSDFLDKLLESNKVQTDGAKIAHDVGEALHEIGSVAETIGPPLLQLAKTAADVAQAIGAPAILTAVATYKAIGIAQGLAASATAFYNKALLANVGITTEATGANTALAASYGEEGLAGALLDSERGIGAFAGGLGALATGALGPAGLVAGVAALAGGVVYLVTQENRLAAANKNLASSTTGLVSALNQQQDVLTPLGRQTASQDAIAARNKEVASLVKNTQASVLQAAQSVIPAGHQANRFDLTVLATGSSDQITKVAESLGKTQELASASSAIFVKNIGDQIVALGKQSPLLSHNLDLIGELAKTTKTIPTKAEIALLINNKDPKAALQETLLGLTQVVDYINKAISIAQPRIDIPDSLTAQFKVDPSAVKSQMSDAAKAALQALRDGITSDQTDLDSIKTNLADAITQGAQAVIDAVNQAKQNLNSIGGSLSSEIEAILVKPITNAQQQITDAQDKLSLATSKTTLRKIGESVYLPGGKRLSTDPNEAIAQLKALEKQTGSAALSDFIQQYQSSVLSEKSAGLTVASDAINRTGTNAATRISNLTDLFNTHKITRSAFDDRLSSLLGSLGITPAAAGAQLGVSGADTLKGLEQGLLQQATAIKNGPQRAGSGLVPSITRPLQTLESTTKQISALRTQEAAKELDESRKQTKLLKQISDNSAAAKFTSSLAQNPGAKSKKTAALTGS